jgi:ribosomal protein L40E
MWKKSLFTLVLLSFLICSLNPVISQEIFFNVWTDKNEYKIGDIATIYYTCNTQASYKIWYNKTKLVSSGYLEPNKTFESKYIVDGPVGQATFTLVIEYTRIEIVLVPYPGGSTCPTCFNQTTGETREAQLERIMTEQKILTITVKEKELPKIPKISIIPQVESRNIKIGDRTRISISITNNGNGNSPNVFLISKVDSRFNVVTGTDRFSGSINAGATKQYNIILQPTTEGILSYAVNGEYYDDKGKKYTISSISYEFMVSGLPNLQLSFQNDLTFRAKETKNVVLKIDNIGNGEAKNIKIKFGMVPNLYILSVEKENDALLPNGTMEFNFNVTSDDSGEYILPIDIIYTNNFGEQLKSSNTAVFSVGMALETIYAILVILVLLGILAFVLIKKRIFMTNKSQSNVSKIICSTCGTENTVDSDYCKKCANKLKNQ